MGTWRWGAVGLGALACHHRPGGPSLPACEVEPTLTVSPVADSDFVGLVPLGNLNPSGHTFPTDHVYFYLPFSGGTAPDVVPVVVPGDGWLTEISTSEHLSASPPFTDYAVTFQSCDARILKFGHVEALDPSLDAELGDDPSNCQEYTTGGQVFRNCNYALELSVAAGDPLGSAGGTAGQFALDLGAFDLELPPAPYANLDRVLEANERLPYATCPADLFVPEVADALRARFSNYDGSILRTVEPRCGEVMQDVAGTAQGIWINDAVGTFYPEDPNLALVHDNVDPTQGVLSVGTAIPSLLGAHRFVPVGSGLVNREPSEVTADGEVYCYALDGVTGAVLVELTSDTEMVVEHDAGGDCASPPWTMGAGAVAFVR